MSTESMSGVTKSNVIILGGGAAGMMAALFSAREGAETLLLEKNEKLGKKVYITGKGRCNLTNTAELEDFFAQVPRNPRFLQSSMHAFAWRDTVALVESLGTKTKVERGGRVFPVSDKASDVTAALQRGLRSAGAQVLLNTEIVRIEKTEEGFLLQARDGRAFMCRALVIATGGVSYPQTGSTGDGYRFAQAFGHSVIAPRGSLVGLEIAEKWPQLLMGLSLKNVRLTAKAGKKVLYNELGEMLFTHFGISGPLVIEVSSHLPEDLAGIELFLNLKPALSEAQLDARLVREFEAAPKKELSNVLVNLLPSRMAPVFCSLSGLARELPAGQVTKVQRRALVEHFLHLPLPVTGPRPVEEAIVTRGGVNVREIMPGSMMSRLCPGLFLCGEVLDVDAHTGGFNLQIAWSTGRMAGLEAAKYACKEEGYGD